MGFVFFAMLFLGTSCSKMKPEPASLFTFQEGHMGTQFTIRSWATEADEAALKKATSEAFAEIHRLEMIFSDYQPTSEVIGLAEVLANEPTAISDDLAEVIETSLELSRETDGAFDITVSPMIRLWRMARKNHQLPNEKQRTMARERSGFEKLKLDRENGELTFLTENMRLDFGGIVKGYSADRALGILKKAGFPSSIVAASGDIAVGDAPPGEPGWRIGIETLGSELTGTVLLKNVAVSTSGDTRQAVEFDGVRYSHIVDPKTGLGLTERIGVTIIAPNATTTDSYATAVSILGAKKGLAFVETKAVVECVTLERDEAGELVKTESAGMADILVE